MNAPSRLEIYKASQDFWRVLYVTELKSDERGGGMFSTTANWALPIE